jgi:hypothetical protein
MCLQSSAFVINYARLWDRRRCPAPAHAPSTPPPSATAPRRHTVGLNTYSPAPASPPPHTHDDPHSGDRRAKKCTHTHAQGDYNTFESTVAERLRNARKAAEAQDLRRKHVQSFIDRFRRARGARARTKWMPVCVAVRSRLAGFRRAQGARAGTKRHACLRHGPLKIDDRWSGPRLVLGVAAPPAPLVTNL